MSAGRLRHLRLAGLLERGDPAIDGQGTASRKASRCSARVRSSGRAISMGSRAPAASSKRPNSSRAVEGSGGGNSTSISRVVAASVGRRTPCSRSTPSSRSSSRQRRSRDSMAATSSPWRALRPRANEPRPPGRGPPRRSSPRQRTGPVRKRLQNRPGDHAQRAFGADEEIHQVHARCGVVAGRALGDLGHAVGGNGHPAQAAIGPLDLEEAAGMATQVPRTTRSRTSPFASTTVRPFTQRRVEPYLKVAAPAALVASTPPTKAPRKVGTGG